MSTCIQALVQINKSAVLQPKSSVSANAGIQKQTENGLGSFQIEKQELLFTVSWVEKLFI